MTKFKPRPYQQRSIDLIEHQRSVGLFLDMGLGKTAAVLTAVKDMLWNFSIYKVLIIAPKSVAEDTWTREADKWDHLHDLRISLVLGTAKKRQKALAEDADIYVINRDNVIWLCKYLDGWPFDMVVIDELSSFKNPDTKRFRALRRSMPVTCRVIGLTGTPAANSLEDLWSEIYLLDRGKRLGKTLTEYRQKYFHPGAHKGFVVYKWLLNKGADKQIAARLSDLCVSMKNTDYLKLPKRIDNVIRVTLSPKEMALYKQLEKERILELDQGEVAALTAATVMNKLLQMANGAVYDDDGHVIQIHDQKLDALEDIVEATGKPILIFYSFRHDLDRIRERFPDARVLKTSDDISDWNAGRIRILLAHPASAGYGLNLQEGGSTIVWYGLTWSLEQYQQANARLYRQGQEHTVIIHHIIAKGTVDENVMEALKKKDTSQAALLAALKERKNEK